MAGNTERHEEHAFDIREEQLGPEGAGLPEIPEPEKLDSSYGLDDAVAIAVTPSRALVFWELAGIIQSGKSDNREFFLIRLRLEGDIPVKDKEFPIRAIGRFQDNGLTAGGEYIYVISWKINGEHSPLMVTNPIRMPLNRLPGDFPGDLKSSLDLTSPAIRKALGLKEE